MVKVAAVQLCSTDDKTHNLQRVRFFIEKAAAENCRLVVFPELFNCIAEKEKRLQMCEDLEGETVGLMKELAKTYGLYILSGSMLVLEDTQIPKNTSLLYSPNGEIILRYDKIHLFDVDIPGKVTYKESAHTSPGASASVVQAEFARIGTTICYDLRFSELYAHLREQEADIITVPSAFTYNTGQYHWEVLLRARAIENQVFIIAPNQCGKLANGIQCYGHSLICDPWGNVLAQAEEQEDIIYAELDFAKQKSIREEMPMHLHRRKFC